MTETPVRNSLRAALLFAGAFTLSLLSGTSQAQVSRLAKTPSSLESHTTLPGTASLRVKSAHAIGTLPGDTALENMSLVIKPSAAQQADLTQLLAAQQDPASPEYHKWLTPSQFGARFGLNDADLAKLRTWLGSQGFTVTSVAPGRNRIHFSGTAAAAESAFDTTLQRFHTDTQDYFENNTEISVPSSLADVVSGVSGISSFHLPAPIHAQTGLSPQYTTTSGTHYQVPWDFRQIYSVNSLISQGYDGTGLRIGVIGQSSVSTLQLTYFQQNTGQITKLPTMFLVPDTGASGQYSSGDEGESELDLEYSSGTAPGANILFIYTGLSNNNGGVLEALDYAVGYNLAQILTLSYGGCEAGNSGNASILEPDLAQASSQGQTILVSSGDEGAAGCASVASANTTVATGGLAVEYPASSPNVTAVGGTQLNSSPADPTTDTTYWSASNNSYGGSAKGYIPETSWNDTTVAKSLSSSGGGASALFGKPSWQTGTGVPADSKRDVPDVAFPAASYEHGYIVCNIEKPCTSGTSFNGAGVYGGTSVAAPNFAALLAVVEQATGNTSGLGNINAKLYSLAAGASGGTIFHDITTGNNIVGCVGGSLGCSSTSAATNGTLGYNAGIGYDQVTGLGSIDAAAFATALKSTPATAQLTPTVTLAAASTTPAGGTSDRLTLAVSGNNGTPTGTVTLTFSDGATEPQTVTLVSGSGNYTYTVPACTSTSSSTCTYTINAVYRGDTTYYVGIATLNLTVPSTGVVVTGTIGITPASSALSITSGSSTTNVINVSSNGFTGTVSFKVAASPTLIGCYNVPNVTIAPGGTVSTTLTLYTSTASCTAAASRTPTAFAAAHAPATPPGSPARSALVVVAAGMLGAFLLRKRGAVPALAMVVFGLTMGLGGCGSSTSPASSTTPTSPGTTYTMTVTATGTPTSGTTLLSATTSFTLTVK